MDPDDYLENLDNVFAASYPFLLSPSSENPTDPSETEVMSLADSLNSPNSPHSSHYFSSEEDELLKHIASEMGFDWPRIARLFQNKTPAQVAKRWTCRLDPNIKKGRWTTEEDNIIEQMQAKNGNNWKLIAQKLPGRPPAAIKSRYYNSIKKRSNTHSCKAEEEGLDSRRSIRQMQFPVPSAPLQLQTVTDKEVHITALRKQLAGLEFLMTETRAEISKLQSKPQGRF